MDILDAYKIDMKGIVSDTHVFEFNLDDAFFEALDTADVRKGNLKSVVTIKPTSGAFEVMFDTEGTITVPCDRCLDDMELDVETHDSLRVKFGDDYQEDDELITIPENEGILDVAWRIYEFIALAIPIKHVHAPGKCNRAMIDALNEHLATRSGDEDDDYENDSEATDEAEDDAPVDPRWADLKKLLK